MHNPPVEILHLPVTYKTSGVNSNQQSTINNQQILVQLENREAKVYNIITHGFEPLLCTPVHAEANSLKNAQNPRKHLMANATLLAVVCLTDRRLHSSVSASALTRTLPHLHTATLPLSARDVVEVS